jgi:hypothetical protein
MCGKRKVDFRSSSEVGGFVSQVIRGPHRAAVSVLDDGRDPGSRGCGTAGNKVFAIRRGGVHEVDMRIDHAGHDQEPVGINPLSGSGPARRNSRDESILDIYVSGATPS